MVRCMTEGDEWITQAVVSVERCIEELVQGFLKQPFAHRVEHSLHVDLYHSLRRQEGLADDVAIGDTGFSTRLVHKEWPSHSPFSSDRGTRERRQSYDIAVLDPRDVASGSLKDLIEGRFRAPIAIELGLDYSLQHIDGDLAKLERNVVRHPYVVHFSRKRTRRATQVEESVLRAHRARTAFAHLDVDSGVFRWKGLNDSGINTDHFHC